MGLVAAAAELEAAIGPADPSPAPSPKRPAAVRNIGHLPEHLPRIERVIERESTDCPCGCGEMDRIGEDRSERLDIVPAQLRVIVTVRPKYACRGCEQGVVQVPAPARLIEGGLPTEGALAHVLVSKYADHSPLYRQAQIYARSGLDLDRSTLAGWVGKASFHLRPVADRLARHLKQSSKLFMDETRAPVLDPGRGKTKTGWLWALARDDRPWGGADPPGVIYFYAPGRGGEYAERFLDGFDGILQVDGYAGYNRLAGPGRKRGAALQLAYCWSHARRRLREIHESSGSEIAAEGLRRIAEIYAIEADIRGSAPERRLAERQKRSAPLVEAFGDWLKEQRARVSPKSRLGEKLDYIARHWDGLQPFLAAGTPDPAATAPIGRCPRRMLTHGHHVSASLECPQLYKISVPIWYLQIIAGIFSKENTRYLFEITGNFGCGGTQPPRPTFDRNPGLIRFNPLIYRETLEHPGRVSCQDIPMMARAPAVPKHCGPSGLSP